MYLQNETTKHQNLTICFEFKEARKSETFIMTSAGLYSLIVHLEQN